MQQGKESSPAPFLRFRPLGVVSSDQLNSTFEQMAKSLTGTGLAGVARFTLATGGEQHSYTIELKGGKGAVVRRAAKPDFEVITGADTWLAIAIGALAPLDAFTGGQMRVRGDYRLGLRVLRELASGEGRLDIC
jgi:putative sterol carrier protein